MTYIDLYCERLGPGLLAEPLNAFTNAAFFVAAWALWRLAKRSNALSGDIWVVIALVAVIGIGSTVFHTFATTWAHWLDIVPILLFQLAFLWAYARRVMRVGYAPTVTLVVVFLAVALYSRQFPELLNGSFGYAPALCVMLVLGLYHWWCRKPRPFSLLAAVGVLAVALFLRTVDEAVCHYIPLGTHFLWHLGTAVTVYLCGLAILASSNKAK